MSRRTKRGLSGDVNEHLIKAEVAIDHAEGLRREIERSKGCSAAFSLLATLQRVLSAGRVHLDIVRRTTPTYLTKRYTEAERAVEGQQRAFANRCVR